MRWVTSKQVELLNSEQFAYLANELIKAEASANNIPRTNIWLNDNIDVPDGGIDARIKHDINLDCRIPNGASIWQYKSGKLSPNKLKEELEKKDVIEEITKGASYYLLLGKTSPKTRKSLEEILETSCENYRIFTSIEIAEWVSDYPPVAKRFFDIKGDFSTFEEWANQHQIPFQIGENQKSLFEKIEQIYTEASELRAIRLVGANGIGKTRFALELIRKLDLAPITIYTDSDDIDSDLLGDLKDLSSKNSKIILVVDNCSYSKLESLLTKLPNTKLTIISIDTGKEDREGKMTEGIYSYPLKPLDHQIISKIVYSIGQKLNSEVKSHIVNIVDGSVKFAVKITDALSHHPDLKSISDLMNLPYFNLKDLVKKIFVNTDDEEKALKSLSLLTFIGLEGDVAVESKAVAEFMEISHVQLGKIANEMVKRGVVIKKDRFRYVEPSILGVWLAKDVWDVRKDNIIDLISSLSSDAQIRLLERISQIGDENLGNLLINYYLADIKTIDDLEEIDNHHLVRLLGLSSPKHITQFLHNIFRTISIDRLLNFKRGRSYIVSLLERLLLVPDTFYTSAQLVLKLASAENEGFVNNATGIWKEIFYNHLGRSVFPPKDRHILIKEAISVSNPIEVRLLGVVAISESLSLYQLTWLSEGIGGHFSQRYVPQNSEEIMQSLESAIKLLEILLHDNDDIIRKKASDTLFQKAQNLLFEPFKSIILSNFEKLIYETSFPKSPKEKKEWINSLEHIIERKSQLVTHAEVEKIKNWIIYLHGNTYHDRLIRWVSSSNLTYVDRNNVYRDPKMTLEEILFSLADEGYKNPDSLMAELDWLATSCIEGYLPYRLGYLDENRIWFEHLLKYLPNYHTSYFISRYLCGRLENGDGIWVEQLLEEYTDKSPEMALTVFQVSKQLGFSEKNIAWVIKVLEKGWLDLSCLDDIFSDHLSKETLIKLLDLLNHSQKIEYSQIIFRLINEWIDKNQKHDRQTAHFFISLLGNITNNWDNWYDICKFYIQAFPLEITDITLKQMRQSAYSPYNPDYRIEVLKSALRILPKECWEIIGNRLLNKEWGYTTQTGGLLDVVDISILLEWADQHKPEGPKILAQFTNTDITPLPELARQLLIRFEDDAIREFLHPYSPIKGVIFGGREQRINEYQSMLEVVKDWLKDTDDKVNIWANSVFQNIKMRLSDEIANEDNETDLIWRRR